MTEHPEATDVSTTDQPVACTLSPDEAQDRLAWAQETLGPHVRDLDVTDDAVVLTLDRTDDAIAAVTDLAAREARCCAFAAITVTIPPEDAVTFRMDVPAGTAPQLATQFEDGLDTLV